MRLAGWFEISLTLALVLAAAYPIGVFMADVFGNRKTFLTPLLSPVERALYRLAGVDPEVEQKWVALAVGDYAVHWHAVSVDSPHAGNLPIQPGTRDRRARWSGTRRKQKCWPIGK